MPSHPGTFIVLTNSIEGMDDEFNKWYDNQHIHDILKVPGFTSAQRFKATAVSGGGKPKWRYLAIYTSDTDQPQKLLDSASSLAGTNVMPMTNAIDPDLFAVMYEPITPVVKSES